MKAYEKPSSAVTNSGRPSPSRSFSVVADVAPGGLERRVRGARRSAGSRSARSSARRRCRRRRGPRARRRRRGRRPAAARRACPRRRRCSRPRCRGCRATMGEPSKAGAAARVTHEARVLVAEVGRRPGQRGLHGAARRGDAPGRRRRARRRAPAAPARATPQPASSALRGRRALIGPRRASAGSLLGRLGRLGALLGPRLVELDAPACPRPRSARARAWRGTSAPTRPLKPVTGRAVKPCGDELARRRRPASACRPWTSR